MFETHINIIPFPPRPPTRLFPSGLPIKMYEFLPLRALCHAELTTSLQPYYTKRRDCEVPRYFIFLSPCYFKSFLCWWADHAWVGLYLPSKPLFAERDAIIPKNNEQKRKGARRYAATMCDSLKLGRHMSQPQIDHRGNYNMMQRLVKHSMDECDDQWLVCWLCHLSTFYTLHQRQALLYVNKMWYVTDLTTLLQLQWLYTMNWDG